MGVIWHDNRSGQAIAVLSGLMGTLLQHPAKGPPKRLHGRQGGRDTTPASPLSWTCRTPSPPGMAPSQCSNTLRPAGADKSWPQGDGQDRSFVTTADTPRGTDDLRCSGPSSHELCRRSWLVGWHSFLTASGPSRHICSQGADPTAACRPIEKPFPRWRRSIVEASRCL